MQDPFYVVRDEVEQALQGVKQLHERWATLLKTTNTASSDEFSWANDELRKGLSSVTYDLNDLADTVAVVESNTARFGIDAAEIESRKRFVQEARAAVSEIERDVQSEFAKGKRQKDEMELLKSSPASGVAGGRRGTEDRLKTAIEQDNSAFVSSQAQAQAQIVRQQDEGLEELSGVVGNLREIGTAIGDELEQQAVIVDELHTETDKADSAIRGATRKVSELIDKQKEGTQWCIIIVLILILVGLIVAATQLG